MATYHKIAAPQHLHKTPYEKRKYSMSFSSLMATAETINSISSVSQEYLGGSTSTDLTLTSEVISGQTVEVWIEGGEDRRRYHIVFKIVTSAGQKLEGEGTLIIKER
jgi:hypothetical protein